jgi:molybdenum cofactor cytidylyltransferase
MKLKGEASDKAEGTLSYGVVILAAGASTRMGRPKLLMPWGETSVVRFLIHQWQALSANQIVVVAAAGDDALQRELICDGCPATNLVVNREPARGMFSSIQCAARWNGWNPEISHWIVALGDQPQLARTTLRTLLDQAAAFPDCIWQPEHEGHPAHPVMLPASFFQELASTTDSDLKTFLQMRQDQVKLMRCADEGLGVDIDYPADYARAWKIQQNRPA